MYDKRPPTSPGSPKARRLWFWSWYLTNAVMNLFDVQNMPADMETNFKFTMLVCGRTMIFNDRDGITRALWFTDAGEVPVYPNQIVRQRVVNPVIGEYVFPDYGKHAALYLTPLDRCQMAAGFSDIIDAFANDLADNDVTIRMAQFLKRLPTIFVAKTSPDKLAMESVLKSVADGDTNILAQTSISDMVERLDGGQAITAPLSEFTEYQQYKIGQFYAMLGVNTVWNLKRENVAATENFTNGETARYNIADIVNNLEMQLNAVNDIFGTDYHVTLNLNAAAKITGEIAKNEQGSNDETQDADNSETKPENTENVPESDADSRPAEYDSTEPEQETEQTERTTVTDDSITNPE